MATTKHVDLSPSVKVEILKELKVPGVTQVQVAKKFGVSSSQESRMVQAKDKIMSNFKAGANRSRKHQRPSKENDVGVALFV